MSPAPCRFLFASHFKGAVTIPSPPAPKEVEAQHASLCIILAQRCMGHKNQAILTYFNQFQEETTHLRQMPRIPSHAKVPRRTTLDQTRHLVSSLVGYGAVRDGSDS